MAGAVTAGLLSGLGSLSPGLVAQDWTPVTREGAYWVRSISGSIGRVPLRGLRVETVGNVVLRGEIGNRPAVYTFKAHVRGARRTGGGSAAAAV